MTVARPTLVLKTRERNDRVCKVCVDCGSTSTATMPTFNITCPPTTLNPQMSEPFPAEMRVAVCQEQRGVSVFVVVDVQWEPDSVPSVWCPHNERKTDERAQRRERSDKRSPLNTFAPVSHVQLAHPVPALRSYENCARRCRRKLV